MYINLYIASCVGIASRETAGTICQSIIAALLFISLPCQTLRWSLVICIFTTRQVIHYIFLGGFEFQDAQSHQLTAHTFRGEYVFFIATRWPSCLDFLFLIKIKKKKRKKRQKLDTEKIIWPCLFAKVLYNLPALDESF